MLKSSTQEIQKTGKKEKKVTKFSIFYFSQLTKAMGGRREAKLMKQQQKALTRKKHLLMHSGNRWLRKIS